MGKELKYDRYSPKLRATNEIILAQIWSKLAYKWSGLIRELKFFDYKFSSYNCKMLVQHIPPYKIFS